MNLAPKRYEVFAREYVIDLNATRAAIAAGYSESTASAKGSQLLNVGKVRKLIDGLQTKRASKLEIKAERVLEELSRLAMSNMADYMAIEDGKPTGLDLSKLTRDQAACIQEITEDTTGGNGDGERRLILRTKFKLADKTKALDMLMRHLGAYNDKLAVTGLEKLADVLGEREAQLRHERSFDSRSRSVFAAESSELPTRSAGLCEVLFPLGQGYALGFNWPERMASSGVAADWHSLTEFCYEILSSPHRCCLGARDWKELLDFIHNAVGDVYLCRLQDNYHREYGDAACN